jgi:hypothetical protein
MIAASIAQHSLDKENISAPILMINKSSTFFLKTGLATHSQGIREA